MDIAGFSMLSSQIGLRSQVNLAVTKMAMDTIKQNSAELGKMLELSVSPQKGASIDIKVW